MPLESFSIGKIIGKGSYGEVYLVKHRKDRKQYVMKKVDLSKASARERKAAELEAKLLSQLRHPNIVSYRESFQDGAGFLYIVMNYCEGGDLYSRLKAHAKEGKPLEETQIVEWFVQIAMALQYIHEKNVLHRDLKTQNIFLTKSKIIKVGDLGIARVLDTSSDMATTLIGTPYYMSPELFSNKPYNHKSDVWALGCCLYEMCTLRHAFNAKDMSSLVYKILKGKVPPLPPVYSSDLCAIVRSMLELEPEKRPSVSRLLRHNYIKKQIALFLEGTKKKQEQKSASKEERGSSAKRRETRTDSSKSDSGYVGSGPEASIVTVSAVECVIDDDKPPVKSSRSSSRDDPQRSSTDSSCSSSGSSGKGESVVNNRRSDLQNKVGSEERERAKVIIKKQMAERKKSSNEKQESKIAEIQKVEGVAGRRKAENERNAPEEKRPLPSVSRFRAAREQESGQSQRPLPKPPKKVPAGNHLPASRSPRARRRYKVASSSHARSQVAEEEEDAMDDEEDSVADSDTSSKSVSERTPQSGLSARERRRQREKAVGGAIVIPHSLQALPSPNEVIAAKVRRSQESVAATPKQCQVTADEPGRQPTSVDRDVTDGARPVARHVSTAVPVDQDDSSSELEEISVDEPATSSSQSEPRRQSDVSSLICALNTTLRLSDVNNDRESPDVETAPEKTEEPMDVPYGASPSTSGRLRDRIDRLKRECIRGIGEELLSKASHIIDTREEDAVEVLASTTATTTRTPQNRGAGAADGERKF